MTPWQVLITAAHPGMIAIDALTNPPQRTKPIPAAPERQGIFTLTVNDSQDGLTPADLAKQLRGKDAVIATLVDKLDRQLLQDLPDLKVIANVAVGFDNIDIAAASDLGIAVVNTPGVLDDATADLAFGLLLATARRICEGHDYVKSGSWTRWQSQLLLGTEVSRATLGIIGFGRIGQAMARRARGFDMKLLYSQRNQANAEIEAALNARYVPQDELLHESDFISVHCPLSAATHHLINRQAFLKMKRTAILINTARGAIINENELVEALKNGTIAGAGLDVFEHEPKVHPDLLTMPSVVLAPHIGSASVETRSRMFYLAVKGLLNCQNGNKPENLVNPECWERYLKRLAQGEEVGSP